MEFINSIFYRKVNPSDFKKLYDIDRPLTGGGQTYLEAAGIDYDNLTEFLSGGEMSDSPRQNETRHIYTINAYVLGEVSGQSSKLEFDPRSERNNYKISRQTIREKHPAWKTENGFPEPSKDSNGDYQQINNFEGIIDYLVIFILRTSYNRYFASFLNSDSIPSSWPAGVGLEAMFSGQRRGVLKLIDNWIPFNNNKETPFGEPSPLPQRKTGGRNILLYGVPGSGKSHTIGKQYCQDESRMERLVFHPDYTYSDFVGQILPNVSDGSVSYEFVAGPFTRLLKRAYDNPGNEYFLVIEELNRGNAPAIFGEVFQLLDRSEIGESEYGISNADIARIVYGFGENKIRIPSNMSILGTMNTSDQNVFTLDTAFQRRWSMRMIENDITKASYANTNILDTKVSWRQFNSIINGIILKKNVRVTSSEDKRLGAFFIREVDLKYDDRENNLSLSEEDRKEAALQNSKFPEKILKYLWDDAFKFSREDIFETSQYISLEDVVKKFCDESQNDRFLVFREEIREALFSDDE